MNRSAKKPQQKKVAKATKRNFTTTKKVTKKPQLNKKAQRNIHVAVIGAAGGIGQPLSMLIKQNTNDVFTALSIYDVAPVIKGVGADLSHIPTSVKVTAHTDLEAALKGADLVIVPAGVPRKPGMTRDDLFNTNASINFKIASAVADVCPQAKALIISNPVNSMVPLWAEVLKSKGVYDPARLFGVTTLDVFRATTFAHPLSPDMTLAVPVVGGHAGTTIVPLFSMAQVESDASTMQALVKRTMFGGDEVVQAKAGGGSATLSMAAAGARFAESVGQAMMKDAGVVLEEYAFVENPAAKEAFGTEFFASGLNLGQKGVESINKTWQRADLAEKGYIDAMVGDLKDQISKGQEWARTELAKQQPM